jgi:signal transduction histidine kinase
LLQVLGNLVTNAIKFTPRGGMIAVRGERTETGFKLSVTDSGVGIPSHLLEAIFARFVQVGKDHRGLGLGLHISRSIVESHGGRLWVESKLGEGSTFYVTVPSTVAPRSADPPARAVNP